jgi:hypothetical protein
VADLVDDKNTSIRRLRQLFFGKRTEKTAAVVGQKTESPDETRQRGGTADAALAVGEPNTDESQEADTLPGHGRTRLHRRMDDQGAPRREMRRPAKRVIRMPQ